MTVEQWAQQIIEKELNCPVVIHDDGSQPGMYDLRIGSAEAPDVAIECVGAVDSVFTETWNVGPGRGPLRLAVTPPPPILPLRSYAGVSIGVLPIPYSSSASAATSSRQKAGMSGTPWPHTRRGMVEKRRNTASRLLSGDFEELPSYLLVCSPVRREAREKALAGAGRGIGRTRHRIN